MNKDLFFTDKIIQLKGDIERWFKKRTDDSSVDVDQANRNAEELIWKFQERYGYTRVRQDREQ